MCNKPTNWKPPPDPDIEIEITRGDTYAGTIFCALSAHELLEALGWLPDITEDPENEQLRDGEHVSFTFRTPHGIMSGDMRISSARRLYERQENERWQQNAPRRELEQRHFDEVEEQRLIERLEELRKRREERLRQDAEGPDA